MSLIPRTKICSIKLLTALLFAQKAFMHAAEPAVPYAAYIPEDKKLDPKWVDELFEKGGRESYSGEQLKYIAMPCGGIGAGQIEICGDGTLGSWWIFNQAQKANAGLGYSTGARYLKPAVPDKPVENTFAIRIEPVGGTATVLRLDGRDFDDIRFFGEYPIATLDYRQHNASLPVEIQSEIFSPFVPLNVRDSANPVTVLRFTVKNISSQAVNISVGGWLQNATFPQKNEQRVNRVMRGDGVTGVLLATSISSTNSPKNESGLPQGNGSSQFGNLAISVLDTQAEAAADGISADEFADHLKQGKVAGVTERNFAAGERGGGGVCSSFSLAPGETKAATFLVSWYFPNLCVVSKPKFSGHIYNNWYQSAFDVAKYVGGNFDRLYRETRLFHDTYFDTTIPYWLANRITMPLSTLACDNISLWQNGRFYAYEGVGFCFGTCGHVYNFVTAIAHLFPELERSVRLQQDLEPAFGFDSDSGRINYRGHDGTNPVAGNAYASDAQSGYVLKLYREYLNSPDRKFLDTVWPKAKQVIGYQIFEDGAARGLEPNGVLKGLQTMWDPMWYGPNPYNESLYLAALRAAEEMARVEGEPKLADRYHALFLSGQKFMAEQMWNGKYFVHLYPSGFHGNGPDNGVITPKDEQKNAKDYIAAFNQGEPHYFVSTACDTQQIFGQNWAHQLNLGYILPPEYCRSAAKSIFRYNWTPDIASVYSLYPPKHRTLGAPGEAGLVNGAWPKEQRNPFENCHDKDDLWTGLEYESACDMINEGLLQDGLTVIRAVHDRYDGVKRNPWNEIEGAEHYSRAMHSWNILLALSGFTYNGPEGAIEFAPKIAPENFKCFFTGAEGWGSFSQTSGSRKMNAIISVKWGGLRLKTISLSLADGLKATKAEVRLGQAEVPAEVKFSGQQAMITFADELHLAAGNVLQITLN